MSTWFKFPPILLSPSLFSHRHLQSSPGAPLHRWRVQAAREDGVTGAHIPLAHGEGALGVARGEGVGDGREGMEA